MNVLVFVASASLRFLLGHWLGVDQRHPTDLSIGKLNLSPTSFNSDQCCNPSLNRSEGVGGRGNKIAGNQYDSGERYGGLRSRHLGLKLIGDGWSGLNSDIRVRVVGENRAVKDLTGSCCCCCGLKWGIIGDRLSLDLMKQ